MNYGNVYLFYNQRHGKRAIPEKMDLLYSDVNFNEDFVNKVNDIGFDLLKEFSEGERADMIFYGCRNCDKRFVEWDKITGNLHLEIDIKNYPEYGKSKNSMQLFEEIIPELFEEGLFFSEQYEECDFPTEYILKNNELTLIDCNVE